MKTIKTQDIVATVRANVKGTSAVTLTIETEPPMTKTGNPFYGKVVKCQRLNGMVGFDYGANVNALAEKEGKSERACQPRAWGFKTEDRMFVRKDENGPETHISIRPRQALDVTYRYTHNGDIIKIEDIRPFLKTANKSSTQADLVGEVVERDIKLENVRALAIAGEVYEIQ